MCLFACEPYSYRSVCALQQLSRAVYLHWCSLSLERPACWSNSCRTCSRRSASRLPPGCGPGGTPRCALYILLVQLYSLRSEAKLRATLGSRLLVESLAVVTSAGGVAARGPLRRYRSAGYDEARFVKSAQNNTKLFRCVVRLDVSSLAR